jgi:hypothetical protein
MGVLATGGILLVLSLNKEGFLISVFMLVLLDLLLLLLFNDYIELRCLPCRIRFVVVVVGAPNSSGLYTLCT